MDQEDTDSLLIRWQWPALVLVVCLLACHRESARLSRLPVRLLWAWESPQDLRFLKKGEGVAFLAGELHLEGENSRWQPRRNPLRVGPATPLMAVIRVETHAAALSESQRRELVHRALQCLAESNALGLQIDFDAVPRERAWYTQALRDLRAVMPEQAPLSITALGSWCWDDPWISGLPVDEAVPMLFRMSGEDPLIRRRLSQGQDVNVALARHSWGVSTDEPLPKLPVGRRVYVFHPGSWTEGDWVRIQGKLR